MLLTSFTDGSAWLLCCCCWCDLLEWREWLVVEVRELPPVREVPAVLRETSEVCDVREEDPTEREEVERRLDVDWLSSWEEADMVAMDETTATVALLANLAPQDVLISSLKSTKDVHFRCK